MPNQAAHELTRGDDNQFVLLVEERDPITKLKVRPDITGWAIAIVAVYEIGDPLAVLNVTTDLAEGITIRDQSDAEDATPEQLDNLGLADVVIPRAQTEDFPDEPVYLEYDVQVRTQAGVNKTIDRGRFVVMPDVTPYGEARMAFLRTGSGITPASGSGVKA